MSDFDSSITAYFGGDTSGLAKSTQEANSIVGNFASQTGEKIEGVFERVEHHLLGTRAIATALGTAIGAHLSEIAEKVARGITDMSEETEKMLKDIAEEKPPEPMLLSIYGRDPRVANDWAQVTLKPAQDAIADFKSNDATNVQFLRVDVALSELLESLRANYPPYKRTI